LVNFISAEMLLQQPWSKSLFDNVCSVLHQWVYRTLFRNVSKLKKRLVQVWSRTLWTLLSTNG